METPSEETHWELFCLLDWDKITPRLPQESHRGSHAAPSLVHLQPTPTRKRNTSCNLQTIQKQNFCCLVERMVVLARSVCFHTQPSARTGGAQETAPVSKNKKLFAAHTVVPVKDSSNPIAVSHKASLLTSLTFCTFGYFFVCFCRHNASVILQFSHLLSLTRPFISPATCQNLRTSTHFGRFLLFTARI